MALGYGQGNDSRILDFADKITEYYSSQGFANTQLKPEEIIEIARFINGHFEIKAKMNLRKSKEFLKIAQAFAKAEVAKKAK